MKEGCVLLLALMAFHNSKAQDTLPVRFNIKFEYETGFQYFQMKYTEEVHTKLLKEEMQPGTFYFDNGFKPTQMNSYYLSAAFFKNKSYFLTAGIHVSKNETTCYGFTSDNFGNLLIRKSRAWFEAGSFSWGLKKEINLKKYGIIVPRINFMNYFKFEGSIEQTETTYDKTTGEIVKTRKLNGSGIPLLPFSWNFLMFFEQPRVGFEYQKRIYKGLHLGLSYSYQFGGGIQNFYKTATSWDLSGQNISLLIGYKFFNK